MNDNGPSWDPARNVERNCSPGARELPGTHELPQRPGVVAVARALGSLAWPASASHTYVLRAPRLQMKPLPTASLSPGP
jgi:hypothetical protein